MPTLLNRSRALKGRACCALAAMLALAGSVQANEAGQTGDALDLSQRPIPAPGAGPTAAVQPVPGVDIHYDLLSGASGAAGPRTGPGRLKTAVSTQDYGQLSTSVLIHPGGAEGERLARLDTRWQLRMNSWVQTLVIGDGVASGGGWSQPVRYGGMRFGRAALVSELPVAGPAPQLRPSQATLRAGVSDYEVEAGALRTGFGTAADRYGDSFAAAAWRQGLGAGFDGEARAEWTPERMATGFEMRHGLGGAGLLQAVVAHASSSAPGSAPLSGMRWGMGFARAYQGVSWNLAWDGFDRGYTQLATPAEASPRGRVQAGAQLPLWGRATAGLSYSLQHRRDAGSDAQLGLAAKIPLAPRTQLSLSVSHRTGMPPGWQAGLIVPMP